MCRASLAAERELLNQSYQAPSQRRWVTHHPSLFFHHGAIIIPPFILSSRSSVLTTFLMVPLYMCVRISHLSISLVNNLLITASLIASVCNKMSASQHSVMVLVSTLSRQYHSQHYSQSQWQWLLVWPDGWVHGQAQQGCVWRDFGKGVQTALWQLSKHTLMVL